MAKKFFETPVVKISNFQTKDVIAASSDIDNDFGGVGDDLSKARIANPVKGPAAGTIKKSGLTW